MFLTFKRKKKNTVVNIQLKSKKPKISRSGMSCDQNSNPCLSQSETMLADSCIHGRTKEDKDIRLEKWYNGVTMNV